jgi:hypothetical protein
MIRTILLSVLLAISLKITDNINEHDLRLFKGSKIISGFFWGIFGSLLIMENNILSNLWLAILLGWILRGKIDNLGHGIGCSLIFITFIFNLKNFQIEEEIFLIFFAGMVASGLVHDFLNKTKKINKLFSELLHSTIYFVTLPLIYSIITQQFIIFISMVSFIFAYETTRNIS